MGSGCHSSLPTNLDNAQDKPWDINNTLEAEPKIGLLEQAAPVLDIPLTAIEQNRLDQVMIAVEAFGRQQ